MPSPTTGLSWMPPTDLCKSLDLWIPRPRFHLIRPFHFQNRLNHRDLQPNIGLFWYFFTEMFEHFRTLFLIAFQMNATILYLVPLTIKLHKQPIFLATIITALTSIFRSYPCVGDIAFYLALFPLWKQSAKCEYIPFRSNAFYWLMFTRCDDVFNVFCSDGQLFCGCMFLPRDIGAGTDCLVFVDLLQFGQCEFLLWSNVGICKRTSRPSLPLTIWHLELHNPNSCQFQIFLVTDLLFASNKRDFCLRHGINRLTQLVLE